MCVCVCVSRVQWLFFPSSLSRSVVVASFAVVFSANRDTARIKASYVSRSDGHYYTAMFCQTAYSSRDFLRFIVRARLVHDYYLCIRGHLYKTVTSMDDELFRHKALKMIRREGNDNCNEFFFFFVHFIQLVSSIHHRRRRNVICYESTTFCRLN